MQPNKFQQLPSTNRADSPLGSFNLWGSIVTIRDDTKPKLRVGGPLFTAGWHPPSETLDYDAADSAGVSSIRAEVGG